MSVLRSINSALSLLTVIPMPNVYPSQPGYAFAYFPLIGIGIGALLMGVNTITGVWVSVDVRAFFTLAVWVLLTGGLHLDGFSDTCDGVFATTEKEKRLEIMKDPRTGSWAVIGLILLLLGKWLGLRQIAPMQLILVTVVARWVMVVAAYSFPYARQDGMGGYFRQGLGRSQVVIATVIQLCVFAFFRQSLIQAVAVLAVVAIIAVWIAKRLGGLTGDTYGALCEITELLLLLTLST